MKYKFKDPVPYKHQVRAFKKLYVQQLGGGLLMPMRSGKSRVAIDLCCAWRKALGEPQRVLIVCGKRIKPVWRMQIAQWATRDDIEWLIVNREQCYSRERYETDDGFGYQMVPNQKLYKFKPQVIIVDESHRVGDPTTVINKHLFKLIKHLEKKGARPKVLFLTGTFLHRKIFMTFGQFKLYDESIFGTNWTAMQKTYGLWGGYHSGTLLKYINVSQFRKKIEPYVYNMKHVPPVPPIHHVVPVELNEKTRAAYDELNEEALLEITGGLLEAPLVVTKLRKLMQVASGYVRDADKKVHRIGTDMRDTLQEYLEKAKAEGQRKVVIFCEEIPQLRDAASAAKNAGYRTLLLHGGVSELDSERRIAAFQERKGDWAFVAQTATGSEGIDLSSASLAIYYGIPQKLVEYDQSSARIRKYKDPRALMYAYIVPERTVIAVNYLALRQGLDLVDYVMSHPEILHYTEEA